MTGEPTRDRLQNFHDAFSPVLWRALQFNPALSWLVIVGALIASCFLLRAIEARWLWVLQGVTPAISVAALSIALMVSDRSQALGWIALPLGIAGSSVGILAMTAVYALLALVNLGVVAFYIAVGVKILLAWVGTLLIVKVRRTSTQGYAPVPRADSFA